MERNSSAYQQLFFVVKRPNLAHPLIDIGNKTWYWAITNSCSRFSKSFLPHWIHMQTLHFTEVWALRRPLQCLNFVVLKSFYHSFKNMLGVMVHLEEPAVVLRYCIKISTTQLSFLTMPSVLWNAPVAPAAEHPPQHDAAAKYPVCPHRHWSSSSFLPEQPFSLCGSYILTPVSSSIFTRSFAVVLGLICT